MIFSKRGVKKGGLDMLRFLVLSYLMLCFLLSSSVVLWADEKKEAEKEKKESKLEEIVVTATKSPKELVDVPASTTVITQKDIEKRNVLTVDQAVDTIPGVVYRQHRSYMTTWPTVTLRGIPGQRRTLVLMDGMPLNEPLNGGVRFAAYAPEDLEKIEVVRGPFSSLYGGYAMGGVVNLLTKSPEKREFMIRTGYGSSLSGDEAAPNIGRFYISYGDKLFDKLSIFLSYGYNSAKNFVSDFNVQAAKPPDGITGWTQTRNEFGAVRYLIGDRGDNDWWDDKITAKIGYDFSKTSRLNLLFVRTRLEWDIWGDGAKTYLKDSAGNPVWSYGTVRESSFIMPSMGSEINFYNMSYETEISDIKAKLSLGLIDAQRRRHASTGASATRTGGPAVLSHSPSEGYTAELLFTKPIFKNQLLTFGASFKHDWAEIKRYNLTNWRDKESITNMVYHTRGKANTYALFVQDEIMLLNNLTAYIGLRHDWWKTFDGYDNDIGKAGYPISYASKSKNALSPKAALVYKPLEKTILRTSFGKAFRPPVIGELYGTFLQAGNNITNWGNPDLKPESSISWDIGVEQALWKGAKVGVTYFENYMKDFIQFVGIDSMNQKWMNVEKSRGRGIEFEAEQRFDNGFRLFSNFTINDTEIKENKSFPNTVGKRLTDVPKFMFNGGVDYEKGPFLASAIGRYKSKIFLNSANTDTTNNVFNSYDPHFVADAKVSYKITKWATVSFSVNNIFDREYYVGPKAAGRSYFGEVTMKF